MQKDFTPTHSLPNYEKIPPRSLENSSNSTIELIRLKELCEMLGLSRTSIWNKLSRNSHYYDADFPKPLQIGKRSIAWDKAEIFSWIMLQKKERG